MSEVFTKDCDNCLQPFWDDVTSALCKKCRDEVKELSNKAGAELVRCNKCFDYFYQHEGMIKVCFWCLDNEEE